MHRFSKIVLSAFLTLVVLVIELILGHFTHSITLLAVANQSMYHLINLIISAATIILVNTSSPTLTRMSTFSWKRLEVVGSLATLVFLGSLFFGTVVEGLQTISHSGHLDVMHNPIGVFLMAAGHFFTWIIIFTLIGGYSHHLRQGILSHVETKKLDNKKRNFVDTVRVHIHQSQYPDIFRDLISCFLLMITSLIVYFLDEHDHPSLIKYVDPIVAILSIILVTISSVSVISQLSCILLQAIPAGMDKDEILNDLKSNFSNEIVEVHEFHVWSLVHSTVYATMHVTFTDEKAYTRIVSSVMDQLRKKGLHEITLQPEFLTFKGKKVKKSSDGQCQLKCKHLSCQNQQCCNRS